jgi:hypothetical protein
MRPSAAGDTPGHCLRRPPKWRCWRWTAIRRQRRGPGFWRRSLATGLNGDGRTLAIWRRCRSAILTASFSTSGCRPFNSMTSAAVSRFATTRPPTCGWILRRACRRTCGWRRSRRPTWCGRSATTARRRRGVVWSLRSWRRAGLGVSPPPPRLPLRLSTRYRRRCGGALRFIRPRAPFKASASRSTTSSVLWSGRCPPRLRVSPRVECSA